MILSSMMRLPARAELVPVVRDHIASALVHLGVRSDDIFRAEVVITEACSNVIRHAYDTPDNHFLVEFILEPDRLTMIVTDTGRGFDPESIPLPQTGQIGGYGVHFIRSNADAIQYRNQPSGGTKLTAEIMIRYETEQYRAAAEQMNSPSSTPGSQESPALR